ncbi:MAG TPA: alanine/ornithine racemase family PLP-dependent enzyme [Clostridia bacterium]|nr:alanine/ornithine racemase family PLP-dependent enzyme [Clostridia bacterium]
MNEIFRRYPLVECNLTKLRRNAEAVVSRCRALGISVTGVIKGFNGDPRVASVFRECGVTGLATSRTEQASDCRAAGVPGPYMMIRVPMPGEAADIARYFDSALVSELSTIRLLNAECARQLKRLGLILMADLGDLREGYWDKGELLDAAVEIETLPHVDLLGVGVNLGCYGAIVPSAENLAELVALAQRVESRIGRRLEIISGGATTSLPLVLNGTMPERINHLRLGEGILQGKDLDDLFGLDMSFLDLDVFTVKAEVLEVKTKPSHPVGDIFVDAYGFRPTFPDRGLRKRALVGIGKLDFVYCDMLVPRGKGIEVLGGSSDHLILDVEDYPGDLKPGDILTFDTRYATMLYATNSRYVRFECTE